MATAANKNKIRTFEAEIGPQNKNIEAGQNFTGSVHAILKKTSMFIKTRNSWVAKSLMSHTFFVKFPGFKHASQENYLTYRLYIFRRS